MSTSDPLMSYVLAAQVFSPEKEYAEASYQVDSKLQNMIFSPLHQNNETAWSDKKTI